MLKIFVLIQAIASKSEALDFWVNVDFSSLQRNPEQIDELEKKVSTLALELEGKSKNLEDILSEKKDLEEKIEALQAELEEVKVQNQTLNEEIKLLNQDNASLEDNCKIAQAQLENEKTTLEEKSTFLHFTQVILKIFWHFKKRMT